MHDIKLLNLNECGLLNKSGINGYFLPIAQLDTVFLIDNLQC